MKSKSNWMLFLGVFLISVAAGVAIFQNKEKIGIGGTYPEVDWRQLVKFDYVTGAVPQELKGFDGKQVKIPGFMVPLEDNQKQVTEFLLVPSPQACVHVPPPPPNQMIHVVMEKGTPVAWEPIWIYGEFNIHSKRSMYGESSFTMKGLKVEAYK